MTTAEGPLRVDLLRLDSRTPIPCRLPVAAGCSTPATMGRGSYRGRARRGEPEPSFLVLGESYNRGWRAECDGRSLGSPHVIDGFANGWRVEPGRTPCRLTSAGRSEGGLARLRDRRARLLALLGFLLIRRRRALAATAGDGDEWTPRPDDAPWRLPLARRARRRRGGRGRFGFAFALRAGVVIGPAVALALWRGIPRRGGS